MNAGLANRVTPARLKEITSHYSRLRVALVGDLCLDRYFEIDPARREMSIETGLPVHNVTRVRCQPGAAGTILNNLAALRVGKIAPVAIIGDDGEGFELARALRRVPGLELDGLIKTAERRTFTYSKPLLMHPGRGPEELSRLDIKNWSPTPADLLHRIVDALRAVAPQVDAIILLDQVDVANTGVITGKVLEAVAEVAAARPGLLILADSRRSLRRFPAVDYKMNAAELGLFFGQADAVSAAAARDKVAALAAATGRRVFVSMSEHGMLGAFDGSVEHVPALPVRGEIDIVGAGDSVTANLAAALGAGASLREAMELAQLAASLVIHQLGTTGTAGPEQLVELLVQSAFKED